MYVSLASIAILLIVHSGMLQSFRSSLYVTILTLSSRNLAKLPRLSMKPTMPTLLLLTKTSLLKFIRHCSMHTTHSSTADWLTRLNCVQLWQHTQKQLPVLFRVANLASGWTTALPTLSTICIQKPMLMTKLANMMPPKYISIA